ncbi:MAG: PLDc N-terminal domain-containing protein, partial [Planctomycetes bacterium]|nr:PLDc N-terminal domain-containing protein [Planctomycetota bacterium]
MFISGSIFWDWLAGHPGAILGVLGYLLTIAFVPVVLIRKRHPASAIAWCMSIILLPYLGTLLFLMIGIPRVSRPLRKKQFHRSRFIRQWIQTTADKKHHPHPPSESEPIDSWPRFIHRVLKTNRLSFLNSKFSNRQLDVSTEDLHVLGLELLEELEAPSFGSGALDAQAWSATPSPRSPLGSRPARGRETNFDPPAETSPADLAGQEADAEPVEFVQREAVPERNDRRRSSSTETRPDFSRAHEGHHRFDKDDSADAVRCKVKPPSKSLDANCPEALERLELLDDLV